MPAWCKILLGASLVLALAACGGGDGGGGGGDAGDAARDAGDASAPDAPSEDAEPPLPDAGPPVTGCELVGTDAGIPSSGPVYDTPPPPDAWGPLAGPGGPARTFDAAELSVACGTIDGGDTDQDHHNTVLMLDGYLWMPFAHQDGGEPDRGLEGGIAAFTFDDPCAPALVGIATDPDMRESHTAGVTRIGDERFMVVASEEGLQFWDVTDPTAIAPLTDLDLPDIVPDEARPDAYTRVVMSVFWQAPYVFAGGSTEGVYVVDARDPRDPRLVHHFEPDFDGGFPVGGVHAIGTMLVVFPQNAQSSTQLYDISDPVRPRAIPGGAFKMKAPDARGRMLTRGAYFAHVSGTRLYYAMNGTGGGLIVYDIADPFAPTFAGYYALTDFLDGGPDFGAAGGYVFLKEGRAFVGLSGPSPESGDDLVARGFADVVDVRDPSAMTRVTRVHMRGDFDTLVPIGNVAVGSVDADAIPGRATEIFPIDAAPDTRGPAVNLVVPRDAEDHVALGARVGLSFDEFVDLETVFPGSFYVRQVGTAAPLPGLYSGQEGLVGFTPSQPLLPGTTYEVVVPAGGVTDASGNPTGAAFRSTFTTVTCDGG